MILKITSRVDILDILVVSMAVNRLRGVGGRYLFLKVRQMEGSGMKLVLRTDVYFIFKTSSKEMDEQGDKTMF